MMDTEKLSALEQLKQQFQRLPGIGARSAERLAMHVLREPEENAVALADAIRRVKERIFHCRICYNLTEEDPCAICRNESRDRSQLWVVEQPRDLWALEATGLVRGLYHVLLGHIAPLEGVEPGDLTLDALLHRVKGEPISEVVLATNPTLEGDGTALHIQSMLQDASVKITRLARGLAIGSPLEFANASMLEAAIRGRTVL